MLNKEELQKRMTEYLLKYRNGYARISENEILEMDMDIVTYIYHYYMDAYYEPRRGENAFFQMFSAIDALGKKDPYLQTMNEIETEFGLDRNIIEVGCGMYPSLARLIAKKQKEIGKGTITAYDPELVTKTLEGVKLVKANFTLETPIPKDALIIGRKPCQATETTILAAEKNETELFLKLCNCNHIPDELKSQYSQPGKKNWLTYLNKVIEDNIKPGFRIEKSITNDALVGEQEHIIKIKKLTK
jgi:hypothetical protein